MVGDKSGGGDAGQTFRGDSTGVSQVIGVVLIVAITVSIAAIVGASVFAFNDQVEEPTPTFTTETQFDDEMSGDGQTLTIKHVSGEEIETDELEIVVTDATTDSGTEVEYVGDVLSNQLSTKISAGKEVTLDRTQFEDSSGNSLTGSTSLDLTDATVRIVWEDPDPDSDLTATIYKCAVEYPNCEQST